MDNLELLFHMQANLKVYETLENSSYKKVEYGNGVVLISPKTSINHNIIIKRINIELDKYFRKTPCESFSEMIEIIMDIDNREYRFKPDIFIMCKDKDIGKFNRKGQSLVGVPKLIFEVVSPSNASHDTVYKRKFYADCGVEEYNLVYQNGEIEQLRLEDSVYRNNENYKDGRYKSIAFEGLNFDLEDIFYDLED